MKSVIYNNTGIQRYKLLTLGYCLSQCSLYLKHLFEVLKWEWEKLQAGTWLTEKTETNMPVTIHTLLAVFRVQIQYMPVLQIRRGNSDNVGIICHTSP